MYFGIQVSPGAGVPVSQYLPGLCVPVSQCPLACEAPARGFRKQQKPLIKMNPNMKQLQLDKADLHRFYPLKSALTSLTCGDVASHTKLLRFSEFFIQLFDKFFSSANPIFSANKILPT